MLKNSALSPAPGIPRAHRPDIEGLRAVAALLVAVYHIWLGRVSGGVDVFFVVSGFLITLTLLRQIETTGRVMFLAFWGRLAKRLLPMSMFVLLLVALASVLWFPRPLWDESIQQTLASILYLQNWQLAFDAVDYLAQGQSASPVQHYWALAVQGQFYLLWPLMAAVALNASRHSGVAFKRNFAYLVTGIFVCSLALSIYGTRDNQTFTYFNTVARLWEFCLGAAVAIAPSVQLRRGVKVALTWIALSGIVACGLVFQVSRVFPGYAALWPTSCALLLMWVGATESRWGADRLLSAKPLVALGGISYALYLWHWPVLIFYRWFTAHDAIGLGEGLAVLGLSIALAALSTKFIGKVIDGFNLEFTRRRRLASFVAAALAPVLVVTIAWGGYYLDRKRFDARPIPIEHPDYPGAAALEPGFQYRGQPRPPLYPGMFAVQESVAAIYQDGCKKPVPQWQRVNCIYGDRSAARTLAIVGGSHAAQWLPALEPIAVERGWKIVVYSKSNCLFLDAATTDHPDEKLVPDKWCQRWNEETLQILHEDRPEVVFTTATRGSGTQEHVPEGYLRRWRELEEAGIHVVAIRDTPWIKFWVPECLEMKGHDTQECHRLTGEMLAEDSPLSRLPIKPGNVHFLDLSEYFCGPERCPPVIGNIIVYRDDSHITAAYARTLSPILAQRLTTGLPRSWL